MIFDKRVSFDRVHFSFMGDHVLDNRDNWEAAKGLVRVVGKKSLTESTIMFNKDNNSDDP